MSAAVSDLALDDARREYRRSQDWLDAHDALATVVGRNVNRIVETKIASPVFSDIIAAAILSAIMRGNIPGVRINRGNEE